jgi:hypothetical protein
MRPPAAAPWRVRDATSTVRSCAIRQSADAVRKIASEAAEAAVLVIDDWQGLGLG